MNTFTPKEIFKAYLDCRKRKRKTVNAQNFERRLCYNLVSLVNQLNNGTYKIGRSIRFVIRDPKPREVYAADFKDRIVHHLIVRKMEEWWDKQFIYDSYSCRKDKGNLAAVDRLSHFMLSVSDNGKERAYFMQMDIKNFFMSIDKSILWNYIQKGLDEQFGKEQKKEFKEIVKKVVFHNPVKNYINKSSTYEWSFVPENKRLENAGENKGLPIGNLTSQFFANIYLNEFDHFIKHTLKCKYYVRYVDDFVLLSKDKDKLWRWKVEIEKFLKEKLDLSLKNTTKVSALNSGINFLGYVQHIHYRLVRRRVVNNFRKRLKEYENKNEYEDLVRLRSSLNSFLAIFNNATNYRMLIKVLKPHKWIKDNYKITFKKSKIKQEILAKRKNDIINKF